MKNFAKLMGTMGFLLLITTLIVLYSDGWRFNFSEKQKGNEQEFKVIQKTGMLAVRSLPEGAKVYINDEARTATDDTISSLYPGKYKLKVIKDGFETWEKEIEVFPELVTDMTAVLVSKSPKLDPLTSNDVKAFALSSNQNNIAFLSKDDEKPGIWVLPIGGNPLNLIANSTKLLIPDKGTVFPSEGEKIWWSPDDKEILVQMNPNGFLLYKLNNLYSEDILPIQITNPTEVFARWKEEWKKDFVTSKVDQIVTDLAPQDWVVKALNGTETSWAPDDEKVFFLTDNTDNVEEKNLANVPLKDVIVYNSEDPLPVGESRIYTPIKGINTDETKIYWYSDSYHLILVEKSSDTENYYTVSIIRIDGTNKTPIYSGALAEPTAVPTPGGEKIIVLTSIKQNSPTNLYGITIR